MRNQQEWFLGLKFINSVDFYNHMFLTLNNYDIITIGSKLRIAKMINCRSLDDNFQQEKKNTLDFSDE